MVEKRKNQQQPTPEQRKAADPHHSAWVAASAGSGKTQVLTDRLMRLLLTGVQPASILCLTYTKAGAAEMSARLFERLSGWATASDEELIEAITILTGRAPDVEEKRRARTLFAAALETPGGLKIQTIHAFCERLLQLFPVEAGLVPGFRVQDEVESAALLRDCILHSFADADEDVQAGWDFLAQGDLANMEALEETVQGLISGRAKLKAIFESVHGPKEALLQISQALQLVPMPALDRICTDISAIEEKTYARLAQHLETDGDGKNAQRFQAILSARGTSRQELLFDFFFTEKGEITKAFDRRTWMKESWVRAFFEQECLRLESLYARFWTKKIFDATLAVYVAAADVQRRLENAKRQRGVYDFDDLISRTRQLLSGSVQAQWVLFKLDAGLTHVLVDEAQDTSPAQWDIVNALIAEFFSGEGREWKEKRTVFVVGDRKQSIFSFQGADVRAFEKAKASISDQVSAVQQTLEPVNLSVSYRSRPNILSTVDAVFQKGGEARKGFGVEGQDEPDHTAEKKDFAGLVEVWPVVEPDETDEPEYWKAPVDRPPEQHPRRKLARLIAETIKSWIGRRLLPGSDTPVNAGDIMILLQTRKLLSMLVGELRRLDVPVAGADRLELHNHIIVSDLMMLIQWLILPQDEHALACVLKSPLVPEPLDEQDLIRLAVHRGDANLFERLPSTSPNRARLQSYRVLAAGEGPFAFLSRVSQLCLKPILQRLGSEADDVLRALLEAAQSYEVMNPPSLAGFAQWFASTEGTIKRELDKGAGEVRIMTVHGSKGLEAPIVILADAADAGNGRASGKLVEIAEGEPGAGLPVFVPKLEGTPEVVARWKEATKEKEHFERMRLLYVGMTRARDALYIVGSKGKKKTRDWNWHALVEDALEKAEKPLGHREVTLDTGEIVIRIGDDPVFVEHGGGQKGRAITSVPDWAKPFDALPPPLSLRMRLARDEDAFDSNAAREGMAVHRFLELAPSRPTEEQVRLARRLGLSEKLASSLMAQLQDPALAVFFGPGSDAEVVISAPGFGLRRIDRMARKDDIIHLLDFKSGARPGALDSAHGYVRQMAEYAVLLREAYPGEEIRAALLWTQDGHLDWIPGAWLSDA